MKPSFRLAGLILLSLAPALRATANAPPGRYNISNGTVYDNLTKLTWQQSADSAPYTQTQAISHCTGLGGTWRIPKISELLSIADRMKATAPAINPTAFADTGAAELFWSGTTSVSGYGYIVDFSDGSARSVDATFTWRVRCVH